MHREGLEGELGANSARSGDIVITSVGGGYYKFQQSPYFSAATARKLAGYSSPLPCFQHDYVTRKLQQAEQRITAGATCLTAARYSQLIAMLLQVIKL